MEGYLEPGFYPNLSGLKSILKLYTRCVFLALASFRTFFLDKKVACRLEGSLDPEFYPFASRLIKELHSRCTYEVFSSFRTFFLDKKSTKKIKPVRRKILSHGNFFMRTGVRKPKPAPGLYCQVIYSCYSKITSALIFSIRTFSCRLIPRSKKKAPGEFL